MPKLTWIEDYIPDKQSYDKFQSGMIDLKDKITSDNGWLSRLSTNANEKWQLFNTWLEEAKEARRLDEQGK